MSEFCGAETARCRCILESHEDGPHVCACEGSWEMVDGEAVVVAVPRLNVETGEQVPGWDPDPEVAAANYLAMEAERLMAMGLDPMVALLFAGPPISVERGGIRYIDQPRIGADQPE